MTIFRCGFIHNPISLSVRWIKSVKPHACYRCYLNPAIFLKIYIWNDAVCNPKLPHVVAYLQYWEYTEPTLVIAWTRDIKTILVCFILMYQYYREWSSSAKMNISADYLPPEWQDEERMRVMLGPMPLPHDNVARSARCTFWSAAIHHWCRIKLKLTFTFQVGHTDNSRFCCCDQHKSTETRNSDRLYYIS